MKSLFIISLFLFAACNSTENHQTPKEPEGSISLVSDIDKATIDKTDTNNNPFSLGFIENLETYQLDSMHTFGAGDCWGAVYRYSSSENVISLDSISCGEYGYKNTAILWQNKEVKVFYFREMNTLIEPKAVQYEHIETIYDYRQEPFFCATLIDTFPEAEFEMSTSKAAIRLIGNDKKEVEKWVEEQEGLWQREMELQPFE